MTTDHPPLLAGLASLSTSCHSCPPSAHCLAPSLHFCHYLLLPADLIFFTGKDQTSHGCNWPPRCILTRSYPFPSDVLIHFHVFGLLDPPFADKWHSSNGCRITVSHDICRPLVHLVLQDTTLHPDRDGALGHVPVIFNLCIIAHYDHLGLTDMVHIQALSSRGEFSPSTLGDC